MIKVYEVSRKYIVLFTHNNRYLPLTGLLTYFVLPKKSIVKFLKYFRNISRNISRQKNHEILHLYTRYIVL